MGLRDYVVDLEEVSKELKELLKLLKIRVFMVFELIKKDFRWKFDRKCLFVLKERIGVFWFGVW